MSQQQQQQKYRKCRHDDLLYLVTYKPKTISGETTTFPPTLLCQKCHDDTDLVNEQDVDLIFDFKTGELIR